jgi:hypothetical protein
MSLIDGTTSFPARARRSDLRSSGVGRLRGGRVIGLTGFYRYSFAGFTGEGMGPDST